jgi:DNA ligase-associated metallophosphoesterase
LSDSPNSYRWSLKTSNKSKRNPGRSRSTTLDENNLMAQLQTNLPMPDLFAAAAYQGTCIHAVNGVELVIDCAGVAYWPTQQALLVADLHFEKGSSFARRGQLLPPYDTMATLKRLSQCIEKWQPKLVVALGDSFHDDKAAQRLSKECFQMLASLLRARDWVWISGNHDPSPPQGLGGEVMNCLSLGALNLRHEPQVAAAPGEIAGHLHPKARLVRRGRSVRRSCFAASRSRMILPSFGAYTGGLNVFDPAFDGLFDGRDFHALMRGDDQVYRIAAGDLS